MKGLSLMFHKVNTSRLLKAGFQLETYDDGRFWAIELEPGDSAARLLRFCKTAIDRVDADSVSDVLVVQCGADFSGPELYIDGYIWPLTRQDFAQIVSFLLKKPKS